MLDITDATASADDEYLIPAPEFRRSIGNISEMTEWRWARTMPDFPKPLRINGRKYYRAGDRRRFLAARSGEAA